jgi:ATP-dependent Zn protease
MTGTFFVEFDDDEFDDDEFDDDEFDEFDDDEFDEFDEFDAEAIAEEAMWRRRIMAMHEAGHAAIAALLDGCRIVEVEIHDDPRGVAGSALTDDDDPWQMMLHTLAGPAAARLLTIRDTEDNGSDTATAEQISAATGLSVAAARREARRLVAEHRDAIERVAQALLAEGRLDGATVRELVRSRSGGKPL